MTATTTARPTRSWMFVPGSSDRFLAKAATSSADCVLLDLEDGVLPERKAEARAMVAAALVRPFGPQRYVRVNALTTGWLEADLTSVVPAAPDGICLPKVEGSDDLAESASLLDKLEGECGIEPGSIRILAAIESPGAVLEAAAIARSERRIVGLMLGAEDLALELGLGTERVAEAAELAFARSSLVYAAAAAGVLSIDGVFPNLDDPEGMERDALAARRLGFSAKSTFNPRQLEAINRIFSPRAEEIAYARKVAQAFRAAEAKGEASVAVGGQLVDRPIVMRALRMLELAGEGPIKGASS